MSDPPPSPFCPRAKHTRGLLAAAGLALGLCVTANASATVIERVIAVVGDKAILFSDLRDRAQPMLLRVQQEVPSGAQRAAATSQVYKVLLESMIDEELEQRAAVTAKIAVTTREIDDALGRVAAQNKLSQDQVLEEATRAGLSEHQYRSELRRQVLEAKLLNLRLQGRIRVTDEDLRSAYRKIVLDERKKQRFRLAWITVNVPRGASAEEVERLRARAELVSQKAKAGTDFAELARRYTDDARTRASGGLLASTKPGQLALALDRAALALEPSQISAPVRLDDRFVVVKLVEREASELPSYDEARSELAERVYLEKMNRARRQWLDGLRRRTHIDVRL